MNQQFISQSITPNSDGEWDLAIADDSGYKVIIKWHTQNGKCLIKNVKTESTTITPPVRTS